MSINPSYGLRLLPSRKHPPPIVGVEILAIAIVLAPEAGHLEIRAGPYPLADRAAITGAAAEMPHRERPGVRIELRLRQAVARLEGAAVPDLELQQARLA